MYNRPEYLEAIYAAFKLGAIPVNMNFRYRAGELVELVEISRTKVLIAPVSLRATIADAFGSLGHPAAAHRSGRHVIRLGGERPDRRPAHRGTIEFESLLGERLATTPRRGGDDLIYIFTGGTTGTPKVVMWTHGNLFDAQFVPLYGTGGGPLPTSIEEMVARAIDPRGAEAPAAADLAAHALVGDVQLDEHARLGGAVVLLNKPELRSRPGASCDRGVPRHAGRHRRERDRDAARRRAPQGRRLR